MVGCRSCSCLLPLPGWFAFVRGRCGWNSFLLLIGDWGSAYGHPSVPCRKYGIERDAPRSGRKKSIPASTVKKVIRLVTSKTAPNATHWTTRSLARATGISHKSVHRILQSQELKPHRVRKIQNQQRSSLRREGHGCRRSVSQPSGAGIGAMRLREEPDSGPRPHATAAAVEEGSREDRNA